MRQPIHVFPGAVAGTVAFRELTRAPLGWVWTRSSGDMGTVPRSPDLEDDEWLRGSPISSSRFRQGPYWQAGAGLARGERSIGGQHPLPDSSPGSCAEIAWFFVHFCPSCAHCPNTSVSQGLCRRPACLAYGQGPSRARCRNAGVVSFARDANSFEKFFFRPERRCSPWRWGAEADRLLCLPVSHFVFGRRVWNPAEMSTWET